MKFLNALLALMLLTTLTACRGGFGDIFGNDAGATTSANLESMEVVDGVLTNLTARAMGGRAPFSGTVNATSDLDDLVATAWGESQFGSRMMSILKCHGLFLSPFGRFFIAFAV